MQTAQQLSRAAQAHVDAVYHSFFHQQAGRQAAIFNPHRYIGFNLRASRDHIPEAHREYEGKQNGKRRLQMLLTD